MLLFESFFPQHPAKDGVFGIYLHNVPEAFGFENRLDHALQQRLFRTFVNQIYPVIVACIIHNQTHDSPVFIPEQNNPGQLVLVKKAVCMHPFEPSPMKMLVVIQLSRFQKKPVNILILRVKSLAFFIPFYFVFRLVSPRSVQSPNVPSHQHTIMQSQILLNQASKMDKLLYPFSAFRSFLYRRTT